ncbi:hypothetical protein V8E51_000757 [Hyaloscypha variabilis]|jgi:hypothetical protein
MDSHYIDPSTQDSRQNRSRSNSYLSSTAAQFQGLNIDNSSASTDQVAVTSSEHLTTIAAYRTASPSTYPDSHPSPKTFISTPVPEQSIPFPLLSQSDLDVDWAFLSATQDHSGSAPLLRLDPAQSFPEDQPFIHRSFRSNSNPHPTNMSTLGIQQYDGRFDATMHGNIRHTYTWPQFDLHQDFLPQNPSPGLSPGQLTPAVFEEPKLLPAYARSLSSSPPRPSLTPEQRELKRQRDFLRRDSKTRIRRDRSASNQSNPYIVSQNGSPDLLPRNIPEYAQSLTPSPLLSQGSVQTSPALGSNSFLAPYSPPLNQGTLNQGTLNQGTLNDQTTSDMYGPVFSMGPNDFTSTSAYPMTFPTQDPNMQAFVGRPHSLSSASDQPNMYRTQQVSPKIGSTESGDHVRVVHSRPKPQCWEHGCNGRQFSTFSNLLRHQREKSGAAQKSSCPNCGAEFTRTTARNGHMAHDKCKSRRNS